MSCQKQLKRDKDDKCRLEAYESVLTKTETGQLQMEYSENAIEYLQFTMGRY